MSTLPQRFAATLLLALGSVTAAADGWPLPVDLLKPAHMPHLENFFLAVRRNKPELLNCPADLAYESAGAVLAANRPVAEGKAVYFKPEDFQS
mgnify:CR=1 FL=1